jgi:hypothetical protein
VRDPDVKTDLNRKTEREVPLPGLVINGYYFLGKDWLETTKVWKKGKQPNSSSDDYSREHDVHRGASALRIHT